MNNFQQTREVIRYSSKYIKGKALDLGAGHAKYKSIISNFCDEYIALDIFPGKNIDVVHDILNTPFEDNSFDTIICTQVLEHIKEPWLVVEEIRRLLKPNGICILTAPFLQPYHQDPEDFFRYTKQGLASLFEKFEIIENGSYGKTFVTIAEFIKFIYFDPYKKSSKIRAKALRGIQKITGLLDGFGKSNKIYSNSYVIAKKI